MMLILWIITSSLISTSFGVDVEFSFENQCYNEENNMKITAKYTGSGTVSAVQWYYSGQVSSNLVVSASTCTTFGAVDAGYPDTTRMSFNCSLATNTFTLTLDKLQKDELDKSWGATFSLSAGLGPSVVQDGISVCVTTTTSTTPTSTTPTTTSTMPTTTNTTPTTTSSTPTTTITAPTTSTKPTTTISTTATSTTTVGNSSDGKLAVIIVSSVVGGLLFVGIAITALFIFHQQRNEKHNTRNQRHLDRDHHKPYKTSKSPYQQKNDNYLYNGRTQRSQVKVNPLNRVSKERSLSRSYHTGASSRYDNSYRPSYTMEHVYPSGTSAHRFMSEYIGGNRNPNNPKHSSYPGDSIGNMRYTDNKVLYY